MRRDGHRGAVDRRTVLKSAMTASVGAGSLLAAGTAGAGATTDGDDDLPTCVRAAGDDGGVTVYYPYTSCTTVRGAYDVPNGTTGSVAGACYDADERLLYFVKWNVDTYDGFVYEDQLERC